MNLKNLSNVELLKQAAAAVKTERTATADVVRYLQEVDRRKLYFESGCTSLFQFLRKVYGYCDPSAQMRVNAVRLLNDIPEIEAKLDSGEVSLTVASNIQSFLFAEKKLNRPYSQNAKIELIEACSSLSCKDVQREFARRNPEIEKRESVRFTSADRLRVSHSVSVALEEKLRRIKLLWSHVDPNMSREDLLGRMAEITLDQIDPLRKTERTRKRKEEVKRVHHGADLLISNEVAERTRYISAEANRETLERNADQGCEFVDRKTGEICRSKFQLQRDHITPWSQGGSNESENLRVYCAAHNRLAWRQRSGSQVQDKQRV